VFNSRHLLTLMLITLLPVSALSASAAGAISAAASDKVAPWVLEHTANSARADFLVVLNDQADVSAAARLPGKTERGRYVRDTLWQKAQSGQRPLLDWLIQRGIPYRSFYIVSLIALTGDRALVIALAARADVARIEGNPPIRNLLPKPATGFGAELEQPAVAEQAATAEPNITYTRAPEVWAMGFTGQGIVIGGQDTGYQWDHPALKPHYRGWGGSTVSHDYNWHDSIHSGGGSCGADSPQPCDDYGHGTHTMGIAVGDDGASNRIGMAPGAKWIGCRNMNAGVGQPSTYLECFEFFLAPYPVGGTPAQGDPDRAPDVTNNSWSCPTSEGCSLVTLQAALDNQQAAGILTVVSATNSGPACSTVTDPPALYSEAYTIGALNTGADTVATFSSRGPVLVDGSNRRKPDISAPGTNVRSSIPGGLYGVLSGTSMAAPHVTGAVALLWSARPALRHLIAATEQVLNDAATPIPSAGCGSSGWPNNTYGYGRLDVKKAVDQIPPDAGALSGLITDGAGTPLAGASVRATAAVGQFATTLSGPNGRYSLALAGGTYTVTATAPGYLSYLTTGLPVLTDATDLLGVSLFVTPTHVITGFVSDAYTHSPVSATLSVSGTNLPPKQSDPNTGYYSLSAPPGSFTLQAVAPSYAAQARLIDVSADQRQEFALQPIDMSYFSYLPVLIQLSGR
jgi:serine protease AprX